MCWGRPSATRTSRTTTTDQRSATVCVPEKFDPWEPENRPKEFKSTKPAPDKGSGFVVYVLKRKK